MGGESEGEGWASDAWWGWEWWLGRGRGMGSWARQHAPAACIKLVASCSGVGGASLSAARRHAGLPCRRSDAERLSSSDASLGLGVRVRVKVRVRAGAGAGAGAGVGSRAVAPRCARRAVTPLRGASRRGAAAAPPTRGARRARRAARAACAARGVAVGGVCHCACQARHRPPSRPRAACAHAAARRRRPPRPRGAGAPGKGTSWSCGRRACAAEAT